MLQLIVEMCNAIVCKWVLGDLLYKTSRHRLRFWVSVEYATLEVTTCNLFCFCRLFMFKMTAQRCTIFFGLITDFSIRWMLTSVLFLRDGSGLLQFFHSPPPPNPLYSVFSLLDVLVVSHFCHIQRLEKYSMLEILFLVHKLVTLRYLVPGGIVMYHLSGLISDV